MVKVAFYKGRKKLFNILTSWWLRGKYSHCELIVKENPDGSCVCLSSSFMDGGVRKKNIYLNPELWDIVEVQGDLDYALEWFNAHEGQPYDVLGLSGFVLRVLGQSKSRWFCSEAIAEMLKIENSWRFDPCVLYFVLKWIRK